MKAHVIFLAVFLLAGLIVITIEPEPGPQITVLKTKQVDVRGLFE